MAAQILFKLACPSCEAPVPIRDQGLIGRKVECPKCKYRFVVEEPNGGDSADDGARPAKGKAGKSASGKSNKTLMVGAGVGGVAVLVLGVVGYFVFAGGNDKPKPKAPAAPTNTASAPAVPKINNDSTAPAVANAATSTPNADAKTDGVKPDAPKDADKPAEPTPVVSAIPTVPVAPANSSGEISNMLPNDSQSVAEVNIEPLRYSTLGDQLFESRVGFKLGAFKEKIGIDIKEMIRLVRGENIEQKWSFNVLRVKNPVKIDDLKKAMNLKPGPKRAINGREYWEIPPNDLIDHLADGLKTELEARESKIRRKVDESAAMGLVQLDETTLVFATLEQVEEFLKVNGKWKELSKPTKRTDDGAGGTPGSSEPGTGLKPGVRGGKNMNYGMSMVMQDPGAAGGDANLTENATFLTVEPPLKAMIDRLQSDPKAKPIVTQVSLLQADPRIVARVRTLTGFPFSPQGMRTLGIMLQQYQIEKFYATVGIEFFNENDVKELEAILKKQFAALGRFISAYLGGIKVEVEGADNTGGGNTGGGGGPSSSGGGGGRAAGGSEGPPQGNDGGGASLPGIARIEDGPTSKVKLVRKARYLFFVFELNLVQRAHDRIYDITLSLVSKIRGMVDMAGTTPMWNDLAAAAVKRTDNKEVPRGTYQLSEGKGGRLSLNWPPSHRVSWMAGLLPYLGQEDLFKSIETDKEWRSDRNLKAGAILIPTFLDPRTPDRYWYTNMESLGARTQAATHFVGMAGVGLDAADYDPRRESDPKKREAMEKRRGAFHFDKPTPLSDVTDGLANTIYVIQVPPNHQRPWIAGGGATVTGVPEKNSIRPFAANYPGNKKGAYVVMLDGSVRFIADSVTDEIFQALCTIKGGETIDELDKTAPKVKAKGAEMKTEDKDKKDDEKKDEEKSAKAGE